MNVINQSETSDWKRKIVSDDDFRMFQFVAYVGVISSITMFGMVANVINIIVFSRMGLLTDSSNVSLLGLAITDFGGVSSLFVMTSLTLINLLDLPNLTWDPVSLMYVAAGWPHVIFVQMTCWVTAYIAFERCMCVVFPFKVKTWFSPQRTILVICSVIFYFAVSYLPVFLTRQLYWRQDPYDNITKLIVVFGPNYKLFEDIANYVNIFISSTGSMIIVMVCTKLTISRVRSSSKFRANVGSSGGNRNENTDSVGTGQTTKNETNSQQVNQANNKEKKLVKMITIICIVFIICNIPGVAIPYVRQFLPDIDHMAPYHNLCYVIYGCSFIMESINSSVNIFVYYNISTRYRQEFRKMFRLQEETVK